jgi:hypothetical protein
VNNDKRTKFLMKSGFCEEVAKELEQHMEEQETGGKKKRRTKKKGGKSKWENE